MKSGALISWEEKKESLFLSVPRHTAMTFETHAVISCTYSQLSLGRICWDGKNSFDLEKIQSYEGLKTIEYTEKMI